MTASSRPLLFCFGFGYCARALAAHWAASTDIIGTTRDPAGQSPTTGVKLVPFGPGHPLDKPEETLRADYLLLSIPPDDEGDAVARHYGELLAQSTTIKWIGYLSTTGVYGQRDGGWVDETTLPQPAGPRGQRRLRAEQDWLDLHKIYNLPVHIFRLAGIYGPGRNILADVRAGTARRVTRPGQVFNRIHVTDITQVLTASMRAPRPGAVYNVCDDEPAPPEAPVAYACQLLGVPVPPAIPFAEAPLSPMARSFWDDNKRVRNDKMKRELGVTLAFPSYREGLQALVESNNLAIP